jgi:hypothetical protein
MDSSAGRNDLNFNPCSGSTDANARTGWTTRAAGATPNLMRREARFIVVNAFPQSFAVAAGIHVLRSTIASSTAVFASIC